MHRAIQTKPSPGLPPCLRWRGKNKIAEPSPDFYNDKQCIGPKALTLYPQRKLGPPNVLITCLAEPRHSCLHSQPWSALGVGECLEFLVAVPLTRGGTVQRLASGGSDMPSILPHCLNLLSGPCTQVIIKYLGNPITVNEMMAGSVNLTVPSPLLFLPLLGSTF